MAHLTTRRGSRRGCPLQQCPHLSHVTKPNVLVDKILLSVRDTDDYELPISFNGGSLTSNSLLIVGNLGDDLDGDSSTLYKENDRTHNDVNNK